MIDFEAEVYTLVSSAAKAQFPKLSVSSENVRSPTSFPYMTVCELSNSTYQRTIDSAGVEHHADVMYQVDVYDTSSSRKSTCKAVLNAVDAAFQGIGFVRVMSQPIELQNSAIYRVTARYRGVISTDGTIYKG